ncbi:hypothetical protein BKA64DRAFT_570688 [Cadophora sp. MPI-SDFR-AT-0126]|nr:hypothetical protein BKA64DRAFT_570688 [Leotiomycetes sp. MPI-SDFR-AT-0126]
MVYHSPYSTPDGTPLAPEVVEASTPWSDVLLEDLQTTIHFNAPTQLIRKYGYGSHKARSRGWGKAFWLSVFVVTYVGRWLATADGTHKDGSFPAQPLAKDPRSISPARPFIPLTNTWSAAPISLLVRIDDDEYLVLPNATSLVSISRRNLNPLSRHEIRIIAPMQAESRGQRRMLEVVTDLLGSIAGKHRRKNTGTSRGILGGVMGWEYLLGEMFGSDHVTIGNDGMCLIPNCIGGRGSPAGLADVFFQSGPAGSEQYTHPWVFQEYTPDVIVMNIGSSDWDSFQTHTQEYNKTLWELSVSFEETYITMIQAIRTLAYPKYSAATMGSSRYIYSGQNAAAGVPIFVMRPFRGQLEQATHAVVDRLRKEGDKSVFWLDTSGWLNTEVDFDGRPEDQDFFLDEESPTKQWRLTERANQKVAILLHMHVCRYLAREVDKCAFLPPEIYLGKALDHDAIRLNEFLEDEKEKKLKKLFWN